VTDLIALVSVFISILTLMMAMGAEDEQG